jgi:hypothetical protein
MEIVKNVLDCETGEMTIVPLSVEELAQRDKDIATSGVAKAAQTTADAAQASKIAAVNEKLKSLGLTVDDLEGVIA